MTTFQETRGDPEERGPGPEDRIAGRAFGFGEALIAAQETVDEKRRVLEVYEQSKSPCTDAPLYFDSRSLSVLVYKSAVEQVRERFWTTTFLASGFWSGDDADILGANIRLMANCRRIGAVVRRIFLLSLPPEEEIQRLQDERMVLRKCEDFDGLARFDRRISNLFENLQRLVKHGCDVRVIQDQELHRRLPAELGVDAHDTELAIYDDWRFDLYQGGLSGTIQSVRGYTPIMRRFGVYRDACVEYFSALWDRSRAIGDFMDRLRKAVEYSSNRIDYHTSWLARYDHALPREDEALKIEELSGVRVDLVRLGRWGHLGGLLDVGTCTGRYPIALRDAVRADGTILGVDNDIDCVRFAQAKIRGELAGDRRLRIERHDFCTPEPPSTPSFDLITCMLGTMCHFERRSSGDPAYDDPLQRALEKFARLLTRNGILFFSVWTEGACHGARFLSIYSEEDKRRLTGTAIPRQELLQRLEAAGLEASAPIPLQDRMELYRCWRSREHREKTASTVDCPRR